MNHMVHTQSKEAAKSYNNNLKYTKKQHWRDWLKKAEEPDIWMANKYISTPAMDGGKARIPVLKHKVDGQEVIARTNSKKSSVLAKGFFPPKPTESAACPNAKYLKQCQGGIKITADQI